MNAIVILTAMLFTLVAPAAAQDTTKDSGTSKDRGGLGGVLDTLGGLLNDSSNKLSGAVVVAHDTTLVLRTDDKRSVRVDTGTIDPQVRQQLAPGQKVTVTARGTGDVLTASDVQVQQGQGASGAFSRVSGTVQSTSSGRVLFKTKDGLTVPVDTSQIRGLPALAANTPATLIYEQGANQESQPVWIEAGDTTTASSQPSASLPSANAPTGQKLEGLVESIAAAEITVQTTDGRHIKVDTANVDRTTLASVRPGDIVTVTGTAGTDPDKFSATTVTKTK